MPTQIYAAPGTFPLKIRESISTRFSDLLEYSATYLIEKGSSSLGFSAGQSIVTSSGVVKIFPAPRITRSNDSPFDEVEVTAYGKGISLGTQIIFGTEVLELSKTYTGATVNEIWRCETATKYSVLDNGSTNYSEPGNIFQRNLVRRWIIGTPISGDPQQLSITWNTGIRDIQRTNYGAYDEVAVMKGYIPEVS